MFRDKEATRSGRPAKYTQKEEEEMRRNSSVDPAVLRRGSRVSANQIPVGRRSEEEYEGKTDVGEGEQVRYKEDA